MTPFSTDSLSGKRTLITGGLRAIGQVVEQLMKDSTTLAMKDVAEDEKATEVLNEAGGAERHALALGGGAAFTRNPRRLQAEDGEFRAWHQRE